MRNNKNRTIQFKSQKENEIFLVRLNFSFEKKRNFGKLFEAIFLREREHEQNINLELFFFLLFFRDVEEKAHKNVWKIFIKRKATKFAIDQL